MTSRYLQKKLKRHHLYKYKFMFISWLWILLFPFIRDFVKVYTSCKCLKIIGHLFMQVTSTFTCIMVCVFFFSSNIRLLFLFLTFFFFSSLSCLHYYNMIISRIFTTHFISSFAFVNLFICWLSLIFLYATVKSTDFPLIVSFTN